jgi:hypothetical protein
VDVVHHLFKFFVIHRLSQLLCDFLDFIEVNGTET